jgi:hypothetical protein
MTYQEKNSRNRQLFSLWAANQLSLGVIHGMIKPFSEDLFVANDAPAREAIIKFFLLNKNITFRAHNDKYDVDLVNDDRRVGLELECRGKWQDDSYPYPVVNVLRRKKHLFDGSHSYKNYLLILNSTFDKAIAIKPDDIKQYISDDNCHEVWCFVKGEGWRKDFVYKIPLDAFKQISLN